MAVTAYTDADNSWTTKPAASISQRIISLRVPEHKLIGFIAGDVLSEHVRVLISSPNRESANLGTPTSDSASILGDYENGAAMLTWAIKMTKVCNSWPFNLDMYRIAEVPVTDKNVNYRGVI